MKKLFPLTVMIGLIALLSCGGPARQQAASDQPRDAAKTERLIPYPKDVAWSALLDLCKARGWAIESQDRESGTIATQYFALPNGSSYCGCQSGRRYDLSDFRGQLTFNLKHVTANGTQVKIEGVCDAMDTGSRGQQAKVDCKSNGRLESQIFDGIDSVVAAR